MREFIYYSRTAPTAGKYVNENDLYESGRLDIPIHSVIASFFLSNRIRTDVRVHLLFTGQPDPPKHLELQPATEGKTGRDKIYINKKNVAGILKKMLYKYRQGKKHEVFPGFWVEKKGIFELVKELVSEGKNLYILDPRGEDIRKAEIKQNPVFILGDHQGLPAKELKKLKKLMTTISIGKQTYFASQTIAIVNNELDRREEEGRL
ncbi:MAG: tRNA (pseudouridine(54)-N(1))-methyltransferase TrmY [Nanoarchaeota archaeon]